MHHIKVSYKGSERNWKGVIKKDGAVIWECCHNHNNRDQSSKDNQAAMSCAKLALTYALKSDEDMDKIDKAYRDACSSPFQPMPFGKFDAKQRQYAKDQRLLIQGALKTTPSNGGE